MARLSRIVVRGVFITGTETRTKKRGGREGGVVAPLSILNLDPLVISRPITTRFRSFQYLTDLSKLRWLDASRILSSCEISLWILF